MPALCVVYGCGSRGNRDGVKFFRIPKIKVHFGEQERERTEKRRRLWISAISGNRKDFSEHARVCSRHFVSGKSAKDWEISSVDWVPTLYLDHDKGTTERNERARNQRKFRHETEAEEAARNRQKSRGASRQQLETVPHGDQSPSGQSLTNQVDTRHCSPNLQNEESQTDLTGQDIQCIVNHTMYRDEQLSQLRDQVDLTNSVSQAGLEGNDEKVKYYTGLPTYTILMAIFNFVSPYIVVTHNSALSKFQQMTIVLMRLRLNLSECDLAYRFNVSRTTISRVFKLTLDVLFTRLDHLIMWPEREELCSTMPMQFLDYFGKRVVLIIDCLEIFIDRPSNLLARAQTLNNYKHHNTIKYLIGIAPQGTIFYLSNAWGEKTPDKKIIENCGFLNKLEPGDLVLADRGSDIAKSVGTWCAEVKMPAYSGGRKQLTPAEVEVTRKTDRVGSRVEGCIGNVRRKYRILGGHVPIDYLDTTDSQGWTTMDKIVRLSCALTNLSDCVSLE